MPDSISFLLFLIFSGSALLATIALFARQALIVAYVVLGIALGPSVFNLVPDTHLVEQMSETGIIFLLFLLGLNLHPQKLYRMFRDTLAITFFSSLIFAGFGLIIAKVAGFSTLDSLIIGISMMFSSTIIGLKLLPTTILHHQHMGGLIISILLLQDIAAILALLVLQTMGSNEAAPSLLVLLGLPALVLVSRALEKWVITPLIARFDTIQEYIFLLAIGWCLGIAELAQLIHLSAEIGAFIAGVALAATPISTFIAESLKPIRDFFLVLFFFSLGAQFDLASAMNVIIPALVLTATMLTIKPAVFRWLMQKQGEQKNAREIGCRLGQVSEFSLLVAMLALQNGTLSLEAATLIQATVLFSFLVSPYLIVLRFPTPIAIDPKLRRD